MLVLEHVAFCFGFWRWSEPVVAASTDGTSDKMVNIFLDISLYCIKCQISEVSEFWICSMPISIHLGKIYQGKGVVLDGMGFDLAGGKRYFWGKFEVELILLPLDRSCQKISGGESNKK